MWEWELDIGLGELHGVGTPEVLGGHDSRANDLDGTGASTVSAGHFIVQLAYGAGQFHISEFTVHVVSSRSRRVTQPDPVVLDSPRVLFDNFYAVQDFTCRLFHLTKLVHVVPELGLGDDRVWSKDDHSVCLWIGVILSGGLAAHHLILAHKSSNRHFTER